MSFTYRENQNTPLTWAQLDGNFREVESVQRDVLNQVEAAKVAAESAAESSTASQLSAELAEEMARISVVRWCGNSTTPPTTRLDGSPLEISDEYGNLSDNLRYNWTGTAWIALNSSAQQLEERLARPAGASILGGEKSISAPPGYVSGRLNDALPSGYGLASGDSIHIIAGIDSLSAGAGGSSYVTFLSEMIRAQFGDAGPGFMAADETNASAGGSWSSSTASLVFNLAVTDPRRVRSFNFGGFTYESMAASNQVSWGVGRDWETMRLFYLKQPGGGKFKVDHININSSLYRYEVDTNSSEYELAYIDITKKPGGTANLLFLGGSAAAPGAYGKVCIYGALVRRAVSGPVVIMSRQARGGHTVEQFADTLDAATQTRWYELLGVTDYFMNGGTNDAGKKPPISAEVLKQKFAAIFSRLPATCRKVMIAPNMHSGDEDNVMPSYRPAIRDFAIENKYGYINNADLIGTRARANALDLMLDVTHPNEKCNKLIAIYIGSYVGIRRNIITSPPTPYIVTSEGGGTPTVYREVALTRKELNQLPADTDNIIYDIGLIGGYPTAILDADLFSNRQATLSVRKHKANIRLRGLATNSNNMAQGANLVASESYSSIEALTANAFEITFSMTQNNGRVQLVARSDTVFNLVATGRVIMVQNVLTGTAVYEN